MGTQRTDAAAEDSQARDAVERPLHLPSVGPWDDDDLRGVVEYPVVDAKHADVPDSPAPPPPSAPPGQGQR